MIPSTAARNTDALDLLAPPHQIGEFFQLLRLDCVGVVVVREAALLHFFDVLADAGYRNLGKLGKALGELRLEVGEDAKEVMTEQNLPVRTDTGTDADRGNFKLL